MRALDCSGLLLTKTASSVNGRRVGTAGADERMALAGPGLPNRSRLVSSATVGAGGSERESTANAAGDSGGWTGLIPSPIKARIVLAMA